MILYFADRHMNLLGLASTELPRGLTITEDLKTEEVASGVATFSCRILYDADNRASVETCVQAGNYILRSADGENEFYTIIETESDTRDQTVYLYAEDAGLDLLNEVAGADQITEPHDVAWYVQRYTYDSGFELGVNEVQPDSVRTLSWEGEQTVTERLASIATQFGNFEVSYSFAVEGLVVTHKYINLYRKRGTETGVQLRLNREVDRIITKKSVANLATALLVTGGTPEEAEDPITLEGYVYDDGDFYVDGKYLKSRNAVAKWSRYVWAKEPNRLEGYQGHIVQTYSYDTTSQQTLCAHAITALKQLCDLEVNYEVELTGLPDNVRIGDTVEIVDEQGQLYLSARVLKLETSITERRKTATFGEYLLQEDGIAQRVAELAAQFSELAQKRPLYTWIAYADDDQGNGISLDPAGKSYLGTAVNRTTKVVDLSDPTVFSWAYVQGADGKDGEDAVVLRIDSSRGTVFKNSAVSTVLRAVIYYRSQRITNQEELTAAFGSGAHLEWSWQRMGEENFGAISADDTRLMENGFAFLLSPDDVDTKVVFQCSLTT